MKKNTIVLVTTIIFGMVSCKKDQPPTANFDFDEIGNFAPSKFVFYNTSTNYKTCLWDFGDGESSTLNHPDHVFKTGGIYNVSLTATNSKGQKSVISKTITVRDSPKSLIIKSLTLTSYPLTKADGSSWDAYSAPDIFFVITSGSNSISWKDYRKEDVVVGDLPLYFTQGFPVKLVGLSTKFEINFYDYDSVGENEYMGGYYFFLINEVPHDGSKYPDKIDFQNNNNKLRFYIIVEWES